MAMPVHKVPTHTSHQRLTSIHILPNIITQYWMKNEIFFPSLNMVKGNLFLVNFSQLFPSVILFYRETDIASPKWKICVFSNIIMMLIYQQEKMHIDLIYILPRKSLGTFQILMNNCGINELLHTKILTMSQHRHTYCPIKCFKYVKES